MTARRENIARRPRRDKRVDIAIVLSVVAIMLSAGGNFGTALLAEKSRQGDRELLESRASALAAEERSHRAALCEEIDFLKDITRRALASAIDRARAALPDPAAEASIAEIQAQIDELDRPCLTGSD